MRRLAGVLPRHRRSGLDDGLDGIEGEVLERRLDVVRRRRRSRRRRLRDGRRPFLAVDGGPGHDERAPHRLRVDVAEELVRAGLVDRDETVAAGEAALLGTGLDHRDPERAVLGPERVGETADVGEDELSSGGHLELGRIEPQRLAFTGLVERPGPARRRRLGARLRRRRVAFILEGLMRQNIS